MLSYYVIYYEKFKKKVMQRTEKEAFRKVFSTMEILHKGQLGDKDKDKDKDTLYFTSVV